MSQRRNIRLYMFLRLALLFSVLFSILFSVALHQDGSHNGEEAIIRTYSITFFTFLITSCFVYLYEKVKDLRYFLSSQIAYDLLFTTALIFYSGTNDSVYTAFYLINIIFAAVLFEGRGALLAALVSSALFTVVVFLNSDILSEDNFFSFLTMITAFIAVALLAGQLVEEVKKSRQKISRLESLNEEIVDSLDSGLLGLDGRGAIRKVNRTARQLFGNNIEGQQFAKLFPDLKQISPAGQVHEFSFQGRLRRTLVTQVKLPENHTMILFRDLSDVLELEEKVRRQERLAGVGRLAAGIAHEIRNPIASMSGAAQLLVDIASDETERQRLLQIIVRESERVDRLVNQLLKFAKPKAVLREKLNFSELISESVEALKTRTDFQEANVNVQVIVDPGLIILGNRDEIKEVVTNLLVNSLQALASGKSTKQRLINIEAYRDGNHVELVVADNGPGIPKEFRSRIFDPFFTTKPSGTGLGLAQVHKIVRDHEGFVDVETEEGKGTALKIRIPKG